MVKNTINIGISSCLIKDQAYLNPYPAELNLRNHA